MVSSNLLGNGIRDFCIYLKIFNDSTIYLLFYVDDMLIVAKEKLEIAKLKAR
jgi:hypothetical protein